MCGMRKATYNLSQVLMVSRQETVPGTSQIAKTFNKNSQLYLHYTVKNQNYVCDTSGYHSGDE